jgi:hypothetical protein
VAANKKLSLNQAKRDFSKTAEPSGENTIAPSEVRRFVIQNMPPRVCTMISVSNLTAY